MLQPKHIYIGSFSNCIKTNSIHDFRPQQLSAYKVNAQFSNPSFIVCANGYIYIVQNQNYGNLLVMNEHHQIVRSLPTQGHDPIHITISSNYLCVCNYSSGSIVMYGMQNHLPTQICHFLMHQGSSAHNLRQQSSHPHSTLFSIDQDVMFVADLGTDILYYYEIQGDSIKLNQNKSIKMAGCGPRHLVHGNKEQKIIYLSGQLDSTVRMLTYSNDKLELLKAYRVSDNPLNLPSEIVYRNEMVYLACRGDNYLIIFQEKREDKIVLMEKFRFKVGEWPRHFKISEAGTIYVAAQHENIVQRFKYENGKIYQMGSLKVSNPHVIAFE